MMASRYCHKRFILAVACLVATTITLARLTKWLFRGSSLGIPSFPFANSPNPTNLSSSVGAPKPTDLTASSFIRPYEPSCNHVTNTSNVLIVVKTGATEAYTKIPTQLITILRCLPGYLIFSDMEQDIAGVHIRDSLDSVLDQVKENYDFDLYHRQRACAVDQQSCNSNDGHNLRFEAWRLDKYKNLHIAEKAYSLRPNYDWYLFIDADTYVLWHNLVRWLGILGDPLKKHLVGSMALLNGFAFAHGGSGYILSRATMMEIAKIQPGIANQYDIKASKSCCGDYVLSLALNETLGISVKQAWPTINGEKPYSIPYGPREWCQPVDFEQRFYRSQGMLRPVMRFKDIYQEFVAQKLMARRDDWDNLSEDVRYVDPDPAEQYPKWQRDSTEKLNRHIRTGIELTAHKSFEHCRELCDNKRDCFQFSYHDRTCAYNKSFRFGKPAPKAVEEEERWVSGWKIDRIQAWVKSQDECGEPIWPKI
ncbi:glycosyltransferase family 31 protein [Daldinia sp. FL1419]|nr:glycosyltransferase family 31 protein [Daldinia sp. FL1419]